MFWSGLLAKLKSAMTWVVVALVALVLVLVGQIRAAKAEVAKQKGRAKRWEATAAVEAAKAKRARELSAEQDRIRRDKEERLQRISDLLTKKRDETAVLNTEAREHVTRTGSAASEAKRLREEGQGGGE